MLNVRCHDKFALDRLATTALELNWNVKLGRKRVGMDHRLVLFWCLIEDEYFRFISCALSEIM